MTIAELVYKDTKKQGVTIYGGGKVDKYSATMDVKAFLKELHDVLDVLSFKDILEPKNYALKGTFVNAGDYKNRTYDMYEKKYVFVDKGTGVCELEVAWECQRGTNYAGSTIIFKLDLSVRNMKDVEIVVGNQKKKMQNGSWEFRNSFIYKNPINDTISKIPIIGKSEKLKAIVFALFYEAEIENDIIGFCLAKIKPKVYSVIEKHCSMYG